MKTIFLLFISLNLFSKELDLSSFLVETKQLTELDKKMNLEEKYVEITSDEIKENLNKKNIIGGMSSLLLRSYIGENISFYFTEKNSIIFFHKSF